jgi:hypothetical protein
MTVRGIYEQAIHFLMNKFRILLELIELFTNNTYFWCGIGFVRYNCIMRWVLLYFRKCRTKIYKFLVKCSSKSCQNLTNLSLPTIGDRNVLANKFALFLFQWLPLDLNNHLIQSMKQMTMWPFTYYWLAILVFQSQQSKWLLFLVIGGRETLV